MRSGNVVSRRDFLVRKMMQEFPNKQIQEVSQAVTELEYEYPATNWDEPVFYDTGKPVNRKKPDPRNLEKVSH